MAAEFYEVYTVTDACMAHHPLWFPVGSDAPVGYCARMVWCTTSPPSSTASATMAWIGDRIVLLIYRQGNSFDLPSALQGTEVLAGAVPNEALRLVLRYT